MKLLFLNKITSDRLCSTILVVFLLLLGTFMLSACGSDTDSNSISASSGGNLYITDDVTVDFQSVIVTIYKVAFVKTSNGSSLTVFEDPLGVTYDLSSLNGILAKLSSTPIPVGSYNRIVITIGEELVLVNNSGVDITPNTTFAENHWTSCSKGKCDIEIMGATNVVNKQNVILDFDLKQFTYDPDTKTVTAKVVLDADGSHHKDYVEMKDDDYELKGIIKSINSNSIEITVIKAKHFATASSVITILVDNSTRFDCDDDDGHHTCNISSIDDLNVGMKVEAHGSWDGTEFNAIKIEVDDDDDIIKTYDCSSTERSIDDFSNLSGKREIEGPLSYTINADENSITVGDKTILITADTLIKDETVSGDRVICSDAMPADANEIEIKFYEAQDSEGASVLIAYKIEFEN